MSAEGADGTEMMPLASAVAPDEKVPANTGGGEESDEEETETSGENVFLRPLVYYRRNMPWQRKQVRGPVQIVWPDKTMALGVALNRGEDGDQEEKEIEDNLLVFTSPGEEHLFRRRRLQWFISILLIVEVSLVSGDFGSRSSRSSTDILAFVSTLLAIALAYLSMSWRNTRLVTFVATVLFLDTLLSLLRMETVWDWLRLFTQLFICQQLGHFKATLLPTWFVPIGQANFGPVL